MGCDAQKNHYAKINQRQTNFRRRWDSSAKYMPNSVTLTISLKKLSRGSKMSDSEVGKFIDEEKVWKYFGQTVQSIKLLQCKKSFLEVV